MQIVRSAAAMALVGMVASLPAPDATTKLDPSMIAALKALGKSPGDLRLPGSVPNPRFKAGTDLLPGIENIVMLMMENHSFDNIWGTLDRPDVDGYTYNKDGEPVFTQKYANGTIQHLYVMPKTCTSANNGPTQNWLSSHTQYDNGSMDGFVVGGGYKPISMAYMTPEQLPFTHSLGETFPIGDRFFCSVLGQTWPNRMYLIAGTSMGAVNTGQNITGFNPPSGTIFNSLDKYGVSWTSYWDEP
jgi:phospholipase C